MKNIILLFSLLIISNITFCQIDETLLKRVDKDTSTAKLNMDATYNRPFLNVTHTPVSLGGYFDMNYQYINTDGLSDGSEFQFRRLSLFVASSISKRVKFLTEIEFENDKDEQLEGKPMEIGIEFAAIDLEFNPLFNIRSGIVINPIGSFNQNHDGPKWEFVDRPIAMTQMLPGTFSNAGFGVYGKHFSKHWMWGYEAYLTGGLDNTIIDNDVNKTYLPHAKENTARYASSNSGLPMTTAKFSIRHNKIGELGLSWMGNVYNKYIQDGAIIDQKRHCNVFDIDLNTNINKTNTKIIAEWAWIFVQLPQNFNPQFGNKQRGGFVDIVQPILHQTILGWNHATLNVALRAEYVDWNVGKFPIVNQNKADDLWSIMPALSFRPNAQTVLRLNYRILKQRDIIGNPPSNMGGFYLGISSYF